MTDQQISILVDIASNGGIAMAPAKLLDLMDLIVDDYVEADAGERYKLTEKGELLLSERGVGVNES